MASPLRIVGGKFGRYFGNLFSNAGGYAVGSATSDALRPGLQDLINETWALHSSRPLEPTTAAEAEIVAGWDAADVREEAKQTGTNQHRADTLRAMAGSAPGVAMVLQGRNRGVFTDAEAKRALSQLRIRAEWHDEVLALRFNLPSAAELAAMAVQGVVSVADAREAAAAVGASAETFDRLYRLAGEPPGAQQLLELWNRGAIGEDDVDRGLRQSRLKPEWIDAAKALKSVLVPVSDLVRMAVREVFDPEQRRTLDLDADFPEALLPEARKLGLGEAEARNYWAAHWNLPSYEQLANMMFRGELTPAQFDAALKAADYAPTWRGKLATIARAIPTLSDFVRFAQREVYSPGQRAALDLDADFPAIFTEKAALHGLAEADARDYWAAHWKLPSATQGYRMLWRDEIDEDGLDGLLKALDYAPTWRDKLANIARPTLGRIDLRRAFSNGLIDEAALRRGYGRLGFAGEALETQIALAKIKPATTAREATAADEATLYLASRQTRAGYVAQLVALGYPAAEAERKVTVTEARFIVTATTGAVTTLHTLFKKSAITEALARSSLAALHLQPWAIDGVIERWKIEATAVSSQVNPEDTAAAATTAPPATNGASQPAPTGV